MRPTGLREVANYINIISVGIKVDNLKNLKIASDEVFVNIRNVKKLNLKFQRHKKPGAAQEETSESNLICRL